MVLDTENSVAQHPFANNFEFKHKYTSAKEVKCPIAAHIRKMRPRADVYISKDGGEVSAETNYAENTNVILRRSVTFGPEFQEGEATPPPKRGIYFMCYQGDLRNGFNFLTSRKFPSDSRPTCPTLTTSGWASNEVFSGKKGVDEHPGQDPVISQRNRPDHPDPKFNIWDGDHIKELDLGYLPWIDQRGGEYFFTPSMAALGGIFVDELA